MPYALTSASAATGVKVTTATGLQKAGRVIDSANTILSGKGAPLSSVGDDGDFYIDLTTMNFFGPKAKGKWPLPISLKGSTGAQGPAGVDGKSGTGGSSGLTGAKGDTGPIGPRGETGATGPSGPSGSVGATGATGAQGPKGDTGPAGTSGAPGVAGVKGDTGATGATGPKGDVGPQGPQGDTGPQGIQGDRGLQGLPGAKGDTGATGATGATGSVGAKGDTGAQGLAGISEAVTGTITFPLNASAANSPSTSSTIGVFAKGGIYLVEMDITYTPTSSTLYPKVTQLLADNGATIVNWSYVIVNGDSSRTNVNKTEQSMLIKALVNGKNSTDNFGLTVTYSVNNSTTSNQITPSGIYFATRIGALG